MLRKKYTSPLEALLDHIANNDFEIFQQLYAELSKSTGLISFNLDKRGYSLYEHAIRYNRKKFFEFLLEQNHNETHKHAYADKLIEYATSEEDFLYWVTLLNRGKTGFDVNETYQGLSLLQHVCLKLPSSKMLQALIDAGCRISIRHTDSMEIKIKRERANKILFRQKNIELPVTMQGDLLIYFTQQNNIDNIRLLNPAIQALDCVDSKNRTALSYAAESGQLELVKYLLARGAAPVSAITHAINRDRSAITQTLLQHGGGMFQDMPARLLQLNINANECYVEGMTIGGEPVTHATKGFHRALLNSRELLEYRRKQDQLDSRTPGKPLPMHSIRQGLAVLKKSPAHAANMNLLTACDSVQNISGVLSLQALSKAVVRNNPKLSTTYNNNVVSVAQYLAQLHPALMQKILSNNPDQGKALQIVEERIDELLAFYEYVAREGRTKESVKSLQAHLAATGLHLSYSLPSAYAVYTGFAFCCVSLTSHHGCTCLTENAMSFFGIPGFVVLGLTTVSILLTLNYVRQYGCDNGVCCGSDSETPLIGNQSDLKASIAALIEATKDENLPLHIRSALNKISGDNLHNLTYDELLNALHSVRDYYASIEKENIENDRSQTPYTDYKSGLFFWSEAARAAYRSAKQPARVVMDEENTPAIHRSLANDNNAATPARIGMQEEDQQPLLQNNYGPM